MVEAYHGSPHEFEAFDMGKIGTGEGAQSYGHGLYFAEKPEVAKEYYDKLAAGAIDRALQELYPTSNYVPAPGGVYRVRIHANKEDFLDWDKPLTEQPQAVRDFVKKHQLDIDDGRTSIVHEESTGEDIHNIAMARLFRGMNKAGTAKALHEAGIPGIKYLDQQSRGQWEVREDTRQGGKFGIENHAQGMDRVGFATEEEAAAEAKRLNEARTSNFVLFNDKLIEIVDRNGEAVRTIRESAGIDPILERKLSLKREETRVTPPGVTSTGRDIGISEATHHFSIVDQTGTRHGDVYIAEEKGGERLYIDDIEGIDRAKAANALGPAGIRDLLRQLKTEFPRAKELMGYRVSGARDKAGTYETHGKVTIKLDQGDAADRFRQLLTDMRVEEHGVGVDLGGDYDGVYIPSDLLLSREREILDKVEKEFQKLGLSDVDLEYAHKIESLRQPGAEVRGLYFSSTAELRPAIVFAITAHNPVKVFRHETIHFLKDRGYLSEGEWDTLLRAARDGNWIEKYRINEHYGELDNLSKLEEAIANEFSEWKPTPAPEGRLAKIWAKIQKFVDAIKDTLKGTLGKDPSVEELFNKIESGEVGRRQPTVEGEGVAKEAPAASKQLELPTAGTTRLEERLPFGTVPGWMNKAQQQKYLELIRQRQAEDVAAAQKRIEKEQTKRQTTEWKAHEVEVKKEVTEGIDARPDIALDRYLNEGILFGEKTEKVKLSADALSDEQKAALPKNYVAKDGIDPDDIAGVFGYTSGTQMIDHLAALVQDRARGNMTPKVYRENLIRQTVEREMERRYGNLAENILNEAQDQVLSETQVDLLHEQTLALASAAGEEFTISKAGLQEAVHDTVMKTPMENISTDKFLAAAGRAGRALEQAFLNGDAAEAFRQSQAQYIAFRMAREAKALEKVKKQFETVANRFKKREVDSVEPAYTNFIHEILLKVGQPVRRSVQDLAEEIRKSGFENLRSFVEAKSHDYIELPVADFLMDAGFRKPADQLTGEEFTDVTNSLRALAKAGRDERKIIREGDEADRKELVAGMNEQLASFPVKEYSLKKGKLARVKNFGKRMFTTGIVNAETYLNRWDRDDPHGLFNQWFVRPMSEAANYKARLDREVSVPYSDLGEIKNGEKLVASPFDDPLRDEFEDKRFVGFTRKNVAVMISNAGNPYNWRVLAAGYKIDPEQLWQWLIRNSTKDDWVRAEKLGKIFEDAWEKAKTVRRNETGVAPEGIKLWAEPMRVEFENGDVFESPGWYHPIIEDVKRSEHVHQKAEDILEKSWGPFANVANGFTKKRTGQIKPLSLDYDLIPAKLNEILHYVAFKNAVTETAKLVRDKDLRRQVTKHYGDNYVDMLDSWVKDTAGRSGFSNRLWQDFEHYSNIMRGNVISTLVGLNPYTVMKHGPTALVNSMYEAGAANFIKTFGKEVPAELYRNSIGNLFAHGPEYGEGDWQFAMKNSEELQRRSRHWSETIVGQHKDIYGAPTLRETIQEVASKPVALSDLVSAVPTWTAVYNKEIMAGSDHGLAVFTADRAVRRAHGSTAATNLPELVRGGGPMHSWLTTLYGFFGTQMQRRAEVAFQLNDIYQLGKAREIKAAAGKMPQLSGLIFATMFWPTVVEEVVNHIGSEDHRGWLEKLFYGALGGTASSFLYLRDMTYGISHDRDPSVGLASTVAHDFAKVMADLKKGKTMLNKQHAGKSVEDFLTAFGDVSGMSPKIVGHTARFGIDWYTGYQRPKTLGDIGLGVTKGTMKRRIEK